MYETYGASLAGLVGSCECRFTIPPDGASMRTMLGWGVFYVLLARHSAPHSRRTLTTGFLRETYCVGFLEIACRLIPRYSGITRPNVNEKRSKRYVRKRSY